MGFNHEQGIAGYGMAANRTRTTICIKAITRPLQGKICRYSLRAERALSLQPGSAANAVRHLLRFPNRAAGAVK